MHIEFSEGGAPLSGALDRAGQPLRFEFRK
jgi:hypothetical protein